MLIRSRRQRVQCPRSRWSPVIDAALHQFRWNPGKKRSHHRGVTRGGARHLNRIVGGLESLPVIVQGVESGGQEQIEAKDRSLDPVVEPFVEVGVLLTHHDVSSAWDRVLYRLKSIDR